MKLSKNGVTYDITDETQIAAFMASGWTDGKASAKPEITKKALEAMVLERDKAVSELTAANERITELEDKLTTANVLITELEQGG